MDNAYTDVARGENHTLVRFASGTSPISDVGGAFLLKGETDGWATDFLYDAVPAKRVTLKTSGAKTFYAVDGFYENAGTSPKLVYDAAGVLGWSPHNLISQSKDAVGAIDQANVTITANVAAGPLGDVAADQIVFGGSNTSYINKHSLVPGIGGVAYCGSFWLKAAAPVQVGLRCFSQDGSGTPTTSLVNVTTSWQQFFLSCIAGSATPIFFGMDHRTYVTGDNGLAKTILVADWQINRGTVPTAHIPTTTVMRIGLAIDYHPVTHAARGLLCEPDATNLALQSAMGRAGFLWTSNGATLTGGQADPVGGNEALQVVITIPAAGNNVHQPVLPTPIPATYTGSMWLKGTVGQQVFFNVDSDSATSQVLVTFTGSWQRVSSTGTIGATAYFGCETYNRSGGAHLPAVTFQCWGAQFEAGTLATSYIPTFATTVLRLGNLYKVTPGSIGYSATAGSWWVELERLGGSGTPRLIDHIGGNTPMYVENPTSFGIYDGNIVSRPGGSTLGINKVASAFANADRAISAFGLAPGLNTAAGAALLTPGAYIGFLGNPAGAGDNVQGWLRKVRYLPRRQSNAELQASTT